MKYIPFYVIYILFRKKGKSSDKTETLETYDWGLKPGGKNLAHEQCGQIEKPSGAEGVFCDGATCIVNCKPGSLIIINFIEKNCNIIMVR